MCTTSNSFKITFLNVCGIKSKLLNPDFHVLIQNYDILVFVETKLDNFDVLQLPVGYAYHVKNRTNCDRKSGGIIVIYKQALAKHINFLNSNSEFVLWLYIVKGLPIPNKILFGCVYIPPENTRYSSDNAFHEIEDEMIRFSRNTKNIFLLGDFNSRTSKMLDFVIPDENLAEILNTVDDETLLENISFRKSQRGQYKT